MMLFAPGARGVLLPCMVHRVTLGSQRLLCLGPHGSLNQTSQTFSWTSIIKLPPLPSQAIVARISSIHRDITALRSSLAASAHGSPASPSAASYLQTPFNALDQAASSAAAAVAAAAVGLRASGSPSASAAAVSGLAAFERVSGVSQHSTHSYYPSEPPAQQQPLPQVHVGYAMLAPSPSAHLPHEVAAAAGAEGGKDSLAQAAGSARKGAGQFEKLKMLTSFGCKCTSSPPGSASGSPTQASASKASASSSLKASGRLLVQARASLRDAVQGLAAQQDVAAAQQEQEGAGVHALSGLPAALFPSAFSSAAATLPESQRHRESSVSSQSVGSSSRSSGSYSLFAAELVRSLDATLGRLLAIEGMEDIDEGVEFEHVGQEEGGARAAGAALGAAGESAAQEGQRQGIEEARAAQEARSVAASAASAASQVAAAQTEHQRATSHADAAARPSAQHHSVSRVQQQEGSANSTRAPSFSQILESAPQVLYVPHGDGHVECVLELKTPGSAKKQLQACVQQVQASAANSRRATARSDGASTSSAAPSVGASPRTTASPHDTARDTEARRVDQGAPAPATPSARSTAAGNAHELATMQPLPGMPDAVQHQQQVQGTQASQARAAEATMPQGSGGSSSGGSAGSKQARSQSSPSGVKPLSVSDLLGGLRALGSNSSSSGGSTTALAPASKMAAPGGTATPSNSLIQPPSTPSSFAAPSTRPSGAGAQEPANAVAGSPVKSTSITTSSSFLGTRNQSMASGADTALRSSAQQPSPVKSSPASPRLSQSTGAPSPGAASPGPPAKSPGSHVVPSPYPDLLAAVVAAARGSPSASARRRGVTWAVTEQSRGSRSAHHRRAGGAASAAAASGSAAAGRASAGTRSALSKLTTARITK